jgi:hypothetical protein
MDVGHKPVATGGFEICIGFPLEASILNAVTVLENSLTKYTNFPVGSTVREIGSVPAGKGELGIGVSALCICECFRTRNWAPFFSKPESHAGVLVS